MIGLSRLLRPLLLTVALAASTAPAAESMPADADPALWVVKDADTTLYLFGTVHLLRPGMSWFDEAVAEAFHASDELRMEVVLPENPLDLAPAVMQLAQYPPGRTLSGSLSESQRRAFQEGAARMGLPVEMLESFEPWFVSLQLAQLVALAAGLDPAHGAEALLAEAARASGKKISAFETAEQQMQFIDGTPEAEQIHGLLQVLEDPARAVADTNALLASWAAGDPEATGRLLQEETEGSPETRRALLTDRNRRWADYIAQRLDEPGSVFIAVGAGHLAGADSVQDFLRGRGITVERIVY